MFFAQAAPDPNSWGSYGLIGLVVGAALTFAFWLCRWVVINERKRNEELGKELREANQWGRDKAVPALEACAHALAASNEALAKVTAWLATRERGI